MINEKYTMNVITLEVVRGSMIIILKDYDSIQNQGECIYEQPEFLGLGVWEYHVHYRLPANNLSVAARIEHEWDINDRLI